MKAGTSKRRNGLVNCENALHGDRPQKWRGDNIVTREMVWCGAVGQICTARRNFLPKHMVCFQLHFS